MRRITTFRLSRRRLLTAAAGLAGAPTLRASGQSVRATDLVGGSRLPSDAWTRDGARTGQQADDTEILSPELRRVIESPPYRAGRWGLLVVDLASGETVYRLNPMNLFQTGSTAKIFSVTAALDARGAGYRFQTPVVRSGTLSPSGELAGDLILVPAAT